MKDILGNHLQNGKRNAILGDPPPKRSCKVRHPRTRDTLHIEPNVVILEVLDDLSTTNIGFP